ncbi:hypothetical protein SAMN04488550_1210 [Gordonia malaquae]|jgi:hypothetical protein|uniref:Uncharacterized protein n=1 Tax=Gordonia malaquae NBRC 108250 TaxID=1223542 RepID=M3V0B1_GORML|nr:hypothetical protein [Gordonia malaquae]GAC81857.1 hypothetical protein GM1_048_00030 [Gordonia malaquae NBRC 108250]SEC04015.1 hypothetical protein SAMN04488550_1210 [Gordonia malaquae]
MAAYRVELVETVRRTVVIEVPDGFDLFGDGGRERLLDAARDVAVEVAIESTDAVVTESRPHDRVDYRL